jgi:6-phosphogluconolactonase (cycloisomerase 2 family)
MKRVIGYIALLCLLALMAGCGATSTGMLAYVSNASNTGFTVFTVNFDGSLFTNPISPLPAPVAAQSVQISPNGLWAYFLDIPGLNIYGFARAGNGAFSFAVPNASNSQTAAAEVLNSPATSLVIDPTGNFLYVALSGAPNGQQLGVFRINQGTGQLTAIPSILPGNFAISQLLMAPLPGGVIYALAPAQHAVVRIPVDTQNGFVSTTLPITSAAVGSSPSFMILSAKGSYLYVLDHADTGLYKGGSSPSIYALTTSGNTLGSFPNSPFHENEDLTTQAFPTNPVGGATTTDDRYLFVANQGSSNVSVFAIAGQLNNGSPGEPIEVTANLVGGTTSPFYCACSPSFLAADTTNYALYLLGTINTNGTVTKDIIPFKIDPQSGVLREVVDVGPVAIGGNPNWITIR